MCGIVAIFDNKDKKEARRKQIKSMIATLKHRGPDGWGLYLSKEVSLGHTRLAILDLETGDQPIQTENYVIVFNGEVYNYIELREELSKTGIRFNTNSDTEVVLRAFEVYGLDAFQKFNGQFALIIWDKREKRLIAARDRYGIRPLYVLRYNNCFYFSSEMKAFDTINGYKRSFNIQNLFIHSLLWNTLDDKTVFNNIRTISAGTFEIYKNDKNPEVRRYYEIGESTGKSPSNLNEAIEEFSELLEDSVKLRLRSDVPVANYLSGGIDSSVITYLTAKNQSDKFKTFSISFNDPDFDESDYQKEMVNQINSDHFQQDIDYKKINDNFMDAVYYIERPIFRTAPIPLYLLSKAVNESGIKVVLTGEAADEILFGYDVFKELKLLELWKREPDSDKIPVILKKLYPHLHHYKDSKQFGFMKMYYEGFVNDFDNELVGLNIRASNNKIVSNYLNKDFAITFDKDELLEKIKKILPGNFNSWTILQKNQYLEMKSLLSGYLLSSQGDRMSLSHGVEGRYPFLDHRIVEKLFYYNDSFKLNDLSQKHLLKEAFRNYIPESITNRPKLPYMAPDLKSFYKNGNLSEMAMAFLSDEQVNDYGIFDKKFTARLLKKFNNRIPEHIGYRDNMLITFILSTQIAEYWARNPKKHTLDNKEKRVEIIEIA